MIVQTLSEWISPLLWWATGIAWCALAVYSLRWPGGIGSRLFVAGAATSFLLSTVTTIDQYQFKFGRDGFLGDGEAVWVVLDTVFLISELVVLAGIFLILVRTSRIMAGSQGAPPRASAEPAPGT